VDVASIEALPLDELNALGDIFAHCENLTVADLSNNSLSFFTQDKWGRFYQKLTKSPKLEYIYLMENTENRHAHWLILCDLLPQFLTLQLAGGLRISYATTVAMMSTEFYRRQILRTKHIGDVSSIAQWLMDDQQVQELYGMFANYAETQSMRLGGYHLYSLSNTRWQMLENFMWQFSNLTHIRLETSWFYRFTAKQWQSLGRLIAGCKNLQSIGFESDSNNFELFAPIQWLEFGKVLAQCEKVRRIILSHIISRGVNRQLNEEQLQGLVNALAECKNLQSLDLSCNNIYVLTPAQRQILFSLTKFKNLHELDLSSNFLGLLNNIEEWEKFCNAVASWENLFSLNLRDNCFHRFDLGVVGERVWQQFCDVFTQRRFKNLIDVKLDGIRRYNEHCKLVPTSEDLPDKLIAQFYTQNLQIINLPDAEGHNHLAIKNGLMWLRYYASMVQCLTNSYKLNATTIVPKLPMSLAHELLTTFLGFAHRKIITHLTSTAKDVQPLLFSDINAPDNDEIKQTIRIIKERSLLLKFKS
jgi:hypothetical protein